MTETVNVQEAKTRLSELLRRVELGESITIARAGQAVATLIPATPAPRRFDAPLLSGVPPILDISALMAPLPEEELLDWEQTHAADDHTAPTS